ncbi:translation initiation factor eIF-3, subunit D [Hesseltinella vesiculosa]|uniref:Eukaryotic translation initiation factor 3 subunit D n=1 Tax=Hesseltinella vesiculosa TaxID=101127 RepID=A0A1X2G581_9FUNG|nr:translation initiation factor eIF-3, subunit D [Hesseltinella vesiculosa]
MTDSKPSFQLPSLLDRQNGWGPAVDSTLIKFKDIPYAPYSKGDKLGRVADWTNPDGQKQDNRENTGRQGRQGFNRMNREQQAYGAAFASAFAYTHNEDESSFSVVDNRSATVKKMAIKSAVGNTRTRPQNKQQQQQQQQQQARPVGKQQMQGRKRYGHNYDKPQRVRNASVTIGPDWNLLDEIEFNRLSKLNYAAPKPDDIATYGSLNYYNKAYDRVNTRNEKALHHLDHIKHDLTTSSDPVMQQLMSENKATVYATDTVLSLLMCATRTVYPWDVVVTKTSDNKIVMDKRPGGVCDLLTVNENTSDPPAENDKDTMNSWSALCNEASYINRNFGRQVLESNAVAQTFEPNPFISAEDHASGKKIASGMYRYRRFNLADRNTTHNPYAFTQKAQEEEPEDEDSAVYLLVRTEIDAAVKVANKEDTLVTVRALNEFDANAQGAGGAMSWKKSLDSQRGAVVATEMRNNAAKLARWAVQALLAGATQLKLGYVARAHPKDNSRHVVLGTQAYKPQDFATQMNLSIANGWGVVKAVIDMCRQLPEGRYVLMKDPNRPILRVYSVPVEEDLDKEAPVEDDTEEAKQDEE